MNTCYFWYRSNPAKNLHVDRPLWPCRDPLISVVSLQTYSIDHYCITSSGLWSAEYLRARLNPYLLIRALNFRHVLKHLQNQYDLNALLTMGRYFSWDIGCICQHISFLFCRQEYGIFSVIQSITKLLDLVKNCQIIFDLVHLYFYFPKSFLETQV